MQLRRRAAARGDAPSVHLGAGASLGMNTARLVRAQELAASARRTLPAMNTTNSRKKRRHMLRRLRAVPTAAGVTPATVRRLEMVPEPRDEASTRHFIASLKDLLKAALSTSAWLPIEAERAVWETIEALEDDLAAAGDGCAVLRGATGFLLGHDDA